jgi:lauroyl/myristoyl acyltransferase
VADRTVAAYRAGATVARALPGPVVDGLATMAGLTMGNIDRTRRAQVERNLRRICGPELGGLAMRRAVAATFDSYAHYWAETFRLPGTSTAEIDARFSTDGWPLIEDALGRGNGVIMGVAHLGGWEWAAAWTAKVKGVPVSAVVEAIEPPALFEWFVELRRQLGINVIPLDRNAGAAVVRALKANHLLCLVCDRDISRGGVEVDFFGERTSFPAGPATLALRTGAPLLPTAIFFRGRDHEGIVRPPVPAAREGRLRDDVARVSQLLATELEGLIRLAPEQWHVMQPNWPSDPGYASAREDAALP